MNELNSYHLEHYRDSTFDTREPIISANGCHVDSNREIASNLMRLFSAEKHIQILYILIAK